MRLRPQALVIIVLLSVYLSGNAYCELIPSAPMPDTTIIAADGVPDDLLRPGFVTLHWTAPGDDGNVGRATRYELRFRGSNDGPIDSWTDWNLSTPAPNMPDPSMAGQRDSVLVRDLTPNSLYYFCIITFDEAGNRSQLSNSPMLYIPDLDTPRITGDLDNSGSLDYSDLELFVAVLKGEKSLSDTINACDFNNSGHVNGLDVVYLKALISQKIAPNRPNLQAAISILNAPNGGNSIR